MKTALVTGGNSGVGKAAATALAKKGYKVIIHGRDPGKTKLAADEIRSVSGNKDIDHITADVSLIKGMKELSDEVKKRTDKIDALVLSTGVILPKQIITADGLEMGFAIQYLSRFATTYFLDPLLRKGGGAKIVHVAAPKIKSAQIYFDNISLKGEFTMMKAMGQEMFANHLMVQEFANRNPGKEVVMNMMHVGIAKTGIVREMNFFFRGLVALFGRSPANSARNVVYLATDESVDYSGMFLKNPSRPSVREKLNYDPAVASRLWEMSLKLIS